MKADTLFCILRVFFYVLSLFLYVIESKTEDKVKEKTYK